MSNVPGNNLLADAFSLICPERFLLRKFQSITTNEFGLDIRRYQRPFPLEGSVQAVDRKFYSEFGLDFTKRHIQVWASEDYWRPLPRQGRRSDRMEWPLVGSHCRGGMVPY